MIKEELRKEDRIKIDVIYLREPDALRLNEKYLREEHGRSRCDLKVDDIVEGKVFLSQLTIFSDKAIKDIVVPLETILEHGDILLSAKDIENFRLAYESDLQSKGGQQEQVSHPSHYAWLKDLCGVEPLDICRHLDFNTGNAIKYLLRKDKVDGDKTKTEKRIEDLRKAVFYIEDEIKLLKDGKDWLPM